MAMSPIFTSTGIASGIDWGPMVDQLVTLESAPITALQQRQASYRNQISDLGTITSALASLKSAASGLGASGVLSVAATSANTAFTATPGTGASAGHYSVEVTSLASAAKARSNPYASAVAQVAGSTLTLTIQGVAYDAILVPDGAKLSDVAAAINGAGLPVNAAVLSDGTNSYLSVSARDTGFPIAGTVDDALRIDVLTTGITGTALSVNITTPALNAGFMVDGLAYTRTTNTVSDAIPGTTLTLKSKSPPGLPEDLVLDYDQAGTGSNIQKFVDAYNGVMKILQSELAVTKDSDRTTTLAGDSTVRTLQADLQHVVVSLVPGGTFSTLAHIGISTHRDGSLSLDQTALTRALARDPTAVNRLFSDPTSGIGQVVKKLTDVYTNSATGLLTTRTSSLNGSVRSIDNEIDRMQLRIDNYKQTLIAEFTAMEAYQSQWKNIGKYLTSQSSTRSSG